MENVLRLVVRSPLVFMENLWMALELARGRLLIFGLYGNGMWLGPWEMGFLQRDLHIYSRVIDQWHACNFHPCDNWKGFCFLYSIYCGFITQNYRESVMRILDQLSTKIVPFNADGSMSQDNNVLYN